ncbi:MAG TPA: hypothetical protein DIT37_04425, partial [Bacillus sp. (in: Bacteria)]|nr:hypothetical protein [Bacillus sp. (in: firmicutes)]
SITLKRRQRDKIKFILSLCQLSETVNFVFTVFFYLKNRTPRYDTPYSILSSISLPFEKQDYF